jgi:hypothetical protein
MMQRVALAGSMHAKVEVQKTNLASCEIGRHYCGMHNVDRALKKGMKQQVAGKGEVYLVEDRDLLVQGRAE